jgi:hypothetical protein
VELCNFDICDEFISKNGSSKTIHFVGFNCTKKKKKLEKFRDAICLTVKKTFTAQQTVRNMVGAKQRNSCVHL